MKSARRTDLSDSLSLSSLKIDPAVVPHEERTLSNDKAVENLMVLLDGRLASGSGDHTIKVWDVLAGGSALTLSGHRDWRRWLKVLPDGRLASGRKDKIKVWDIVWDTSGDAPAFSLMLSEPTEFSGHRGDDVECITVLVDGRLASGSANTIKVWDVLGGEGAFTLEEGYGGWVYCLMVLADGRLASGSDGMIKVWDVLAGSCVLTLLGHTSYVSCLTVLADGRLVSGSGDKTIKVWELLRGTCALTLSGHSENIRCLTVLPDGRLASGSDDHTIKVWELLGGTCALTLSGHSDWVTCLTVLPDGRLASGSEDSTIKVWDLGFRLVKASTKTSVSSDSHHSDDTFGDVAVSSGRSLFIPEDEVVLGLKLGQGGFGVVYCAEYDFQTVAVKRYEGTRLPERQAREVRHEVSIMQKLQHECLIRLLGLVQTQEGPGMLVMEFAANGSLYDYLHSDQEMAWTLRLRMAHELARGLAYLHKQSIVHRDIKSLNVVLDRDLHAKWCDFGLAVLKLHSTTTTKESAQSVAGTLRWMAPELFARKTSNPSTTSDIWALGMVYFELASRQIPFSDARDNEQVKDFIKEATGEEVPEECESAAPAFAAIMRRCWLSRNERPTAAELATELRGVIVTEPVVSPNAGLKKAVPAPDDVTASYSHYHRYT